MPLVKPAWPILQRENLLAQGLVGAWPFYEGSGTTLNDLSGNGSTGTLTGTVSWSSGQLGSALTFTNASTSRVALPQIIKQNTFTIAAWINPTAGQLDDGAGIFYQGAGSSSAGTDFLYVDGRGLNVNAIFIRYEAGTFGQTPANTITKNAWNRVLWSFNAGSSQVFINGVLQLTASGMGSGAPAANTASIGQWYNYTDSLRTFIGQIDGVSVWSRPLNSAEAAQDYFDSFSIYRPERRVPWFTVAGDAAAVDWGEFNNWEYPYRPKRRRDLGGPSFVAMPQGDILPLRLGYDLAPQPLLPPMADRVLKSLPEISGPTFVTSKPADLLPLSLGYELTTPPFLPGGNRPYDKGTVVNASGPYFVAATPSDILPLRLGYDLAIQPLLQPGADRVIKSVPEVSGPTFVTAAPGDLLPLRLGYDLTPPPLLPSENRAVNKGAVLSAISNLPNVLVAPPATFTWSADPVLFYAKSEISRAAALVGATFVTVKPSDVAAPVLGYDLTPPALVERLPRIAGLGGILTSGPYFVIASPGDIQTPALGYDLAPPPLTRAVRPPSIMVAAGSTLVLSAAGDLLPLALGYELTTPALARSRRRVPIPDTFNEPSVLVVITVPTAYGYDAAPQPLLSVGRLRRPGALLGQPVLVLSQPADLRAPVFGYDLAPPAQGRVARRVPLPDVFVPSDVFVPPTAAFTWSPDPGLPMLRRRRWVDAGASVVLLPPADLFGYELVPAGSLIAARRPKLKLETGATLVLSPPAADVWGFGLTPNAPLIMRRRLIATGPTFVAASPGDIARLALGYELTTPPLLPVPAGRRGGQFAIPVFVPVAASDLRAPDYGYELTPGLYTLLRAISHNTGFFLQSQLLLPLFQQIGFVRLIDEFMAASDANSESLTAASAADEELE